MFWDNILEKPTAKHQKWVWDFLNSGEINNLLLSSVQLYNYTVNGQKFIWIWRLFRLKNEPQPQQGSFEGLDQ